MFTLSSLLRGNNRTIVRATEPTPVVPGYPWALTRHIELTDGAALFIRPIRPDDAPRLVAFFERLSPRSIYQRFFRAYDRLPDHWYHHFANVDYRARLALVAEEPGGILHALAQYEPGPGPGVTEIAIAVEDAWQRRGLGGLVLDALLTAAEARGLHRFTADVLADNQPMLRMLRRRVTIHRRELEAGILTIEFERRPTTERPRLAEWRLA